VKAAPVDKFEWILREETETTAGILGLQVIAAESFTIH
jgi:hypothetical protein